MKCLEVIINLLSCSCCFNLCLYWCRLEWSWNWWRSFPSWSGLQTITKPLVSICRLETKLIFLTLMHKISSPIFFQESSRTRNQYTLLGDFIMCFVFSLDAKKPTVEVVGSIQHEVSWGVSTLVPFRLLSNIIL